MPSNVLVDCSPFQILHGTLPNIDDLRIFGCLCYVSSHVVSRSKFDVRAKKFVSLGFKPRMKGDVVFDVISKQVLVSRN